MISFKTLDKMAAHFVCLKVLSKSFLLAIYICYITQPLARWNVFTIITQNHILILYYTKKSLHPCDIINPLLLLME